jgi:hypothetical protein
LSLRLFALPESRPRAEQAARSRNTLLSRDDFRGRSSLAGVGEQEADLPRPESNWHKVAQEQCRALAMTDRTVGPMSKNLYFAGTLVMGTAGFEPATSRV